jgi:hypothetical protein
MGTARFDPEQEPFGREQLESWSDLCFIERSLTTGLQTQSNDLYAYSAEASYFPIGEQRRYSSTLDLVKPRAPLFSAGRASGTSRCRRAARP